MRRLRTPARRWTRSRGASKRHTPTRNAGERVFMTPYLDELVGGARPALVVLLGTVGLVLLITCANMAGLLIARSQARRQEVAVRTALGASRLALIRQFLSESFVLALTGGLLGIGLAVGGVEILIGLSPEQVPRLAQSGLDLPVLAFALVATLVTGLLFGLAPTLQAFEARARRWHADYITTTGRPRARRCRDDASSPVKKSRFCSRRKFGGQVQGRCDSAERPS